MINQQLRYTIVQRETYSFTEYFVSLYPKCCYGWALYMNHTYFFISLHHGAFSSLCLHILFYQPRIFWRLNKKLTKIIIYPIIAILIISMKIYFKSRKEYKSVNKKLSGNGRLFCFPKLYASSSLSHYYFGLYCFHLQEMPVHLNGQGEVLIIPYH